jgi:hypothetical protein
MHELYATLATTCSGKIYLHMRYHYHQALQRLQLCKVETQGARSLPSYRTNVRKLAGRMTDCVFNFAEELLQSPLTFGPQQTKPDEVPTEIAKTPGKDFTESDLVCALPASALKELKVRAQSNNRSVTRAIDLYLGLPIATSVLSNTPNVMVNAMYLERLAEIATTISQVVMDLAKKKRKTKFDFWNSPVGVLVRCNKIIWHQGVVASSTRSVCALCCSQSRTTSLCMICGEKLCEACFKIFHEQENIVPVFNSEKDDTSPVSNQQATPVSATTSTTGTTEGMTPTTEHSLPEPSPKQLDFETPSATSELPSTTATAQKAQRQKKLKRS